MVQISLPIFPLISRDRDLIVERILILWRNVDNTEIRSSI